MLKTVDHRRVRLTPHVQSGQPGYMYEVFAAQGSGVCHGWAAGSEDEATRGAIEHADDVYRSRLRAATLARKARAI